MRKDTTFSSNKLTGEEFSKKYWKNGEFVYQYHTANIEDGRDEREQFVFNNINALKRLIDFQSKCTRDRCGELEQEKEKIKKSITALALTNAVIGIVVVQLLLRNKV